MKNGFFTIISAYTLFTRRQGFHRAHLILVFFTLVCISTTSQATGSGTTSSQAKSTSHAGVSMSDSAALRQCIKTATQARRLLLTGNAILVDVRERKLRHTSIPEALTIPLYALESKSFLYGKNVVIVGSGLNDNELTKSCIKLRRKGNGRVYVVKGGLPSWSKISGENGVKLSADLAEKIITPRELYRLIAHRADMQIIEMGSGRADVKSKNVFVNSVQLPNEPNMTDDRILSSLKAMIDEFSGDTTIVVVTNDGGGYMQIQKFLKNNGIYRDFYLQGGLEAYIKYMNTRQGFLEKKKMGPVERVGCGDM